MQEHILSDRCHLVLQITQESHLSIFTESSRLITEVPKCTDGMNKKKDKKQPVFPLETDLTELHFACDGNQGHPLCRDVSMPIIRGKAFISIAVHFSPLAQTD